MNSINLVGRITKDLQVESLQNGSNVLNLILAVNSNYKNSEGVYETNFFKCELWNKLAINTAEYCRKGDVIGIKGQMELNPYETDGIKKIDAKVKVESIEFISTGKQFDKTEKEEDIFEF